MGQALGMTWGYLVAVGVLLSVSGCGGSDGADSAGPVSCSASLPGSAGGAAAPLLCVDLVGGTAQDVADNRKQCVQQGNTFAFGLCPHAGAGGGCRVSQGSQQITTWYYDGVTASDTKSLCDGLASFASGGVTITFVLP